MEFSEFAQYVFYGLISGTAMLAVYSLRELNQSVNTLNVKIAAILERQLIHDERIDRLESHVYRIGDDGH